MENLEQQIKLNGIKTGVFLGLIITALSILSYHFIMIMSKSPVIFIAAPIIFSKLIPVFLVVIFSLSQRKKIGGYWTFKQATTGVFTMLLTAYLIQFVGKDLIFDKVIEPNNVENTQHVALEIIKHSGGKQQDIDKNTADLKAEFRREGNITVGSSIQTVVFSTLFAFVFAIIFASLFKKDPPIYTS